MEEAPKNGKESSHSAHGDGMKYAKCRKRLSLKLCNQLEYQGSGGCTILKWITG